MVYTKEGVDQKQVVEKFLKILSKHHLWLKPEKCKFFKSKAKYLDISQVGKNGLE